MPLSIAAFSAGRPNESQPIGCNTCTVHVTDLNHKTIMQASNKSRLVARLVLLAIYHFPLHSLTASQCITDGVHSNMAHVELSRWIWEHGQDIELGSFHSSTGNALC